MTSNLRLAAIFVLIALYYTGADARSFWTFGRSRSTSSTTETPESASHSSSRGVPDVVEGVLKFLRVECEVECAQEIWQMMQDNCSRARFQSVCYLEYNFQQSKIRQLLRTYEECTGHSGSKALSEAPVTQQDVDETLADLISSLDAEDGGPLSAACKNQLTKSLSDRCDDGEDTSCMMAALQDPDSVEQLQEGARQCRKQDIDDNLIDQVDAVLTVKMPDPCAEETLSLARELCGDGNSTLTCENSIMDDYPNRERLVNDSAICYFNYRTKREPFTAEPVKQTYNDVDAAIQNQAKKIVREMGTGDAGEISEAIIDYLAYWCPVNRRLLYTCEARALSNSSTLMALSLAGWLGYVHQNDLRNGAEPPSTESSSTTTMALPFDDNVPDFQTPQDVIAYLKSKLGVDVSSGCEQESEDAVNNLCPDKTSRNTCVANALQNQTGRDILFSPTVKCFYQHAVSNNPLTAFDLDYTGATIEDAVEDGVVSLLEEMTTRLGIPYTEKLEDIGFDEVLRRCSSEEEDIDTLKCSYDSLKDITTATSIGEDIWLNYVQDMLTDE